MKEKWKNVSDHNLSHLHARTHHHAHWKGFKAFNFSLFCFAVCLPSKYQRHKNVSGTSYFSQEQSLCLCSDNFIFFFLRGIAVRFHSFLRFAQVLSMTEKIAEVSVYFVFIVNLFDSLSLVVWAIDWRRSFCVFIFAYIFFFFLFWFHSTDYLRVVDIRLMTISFFYCLFFLFFFFFFSFHLKCLFLNVMYTYVFIAELFNTTS